MADTMPFPSLIFPSHYAAVRILGSSEHRSERMHANPVNTAGLLLDLGSWHVVEWSLSSEKRFGLAPERLFETCTSLQILLLLIFLRLSLGPPSRNCLPGNFFPLLRCHRAEPRLAAFSAQRHSIGVFFFLRHR